MKKQASTPKRERQLKLAEAGILFVLILGITIFVGARMFGGGETVEPQVVAENTVENTVENTFENTVENTIEAPVAAEIPVDTAVLGSEAETGETLAQRPPRVVTYAASEAAFFAGDFQEAADMFSAYTLEYPGNAWGHYMAGLSSWKAGDPDGSEEAFLAALEIKPDHLKSRINYGRVLLEMDRAQEAREQLEAALVIDAQSVDAHRVLGRTYHNLGLLDEAAASYRSALALRIDDAWSLNNLGLVYIEQERFDEALPALARAAGLKNAACILNNLGVALERGEHYQDAVEAYERALEVDANYAKAEESLGRVADRAAAQSEARVDLAAIAASFTVGEPMYARFDETPEEFVIEEATDAEPDTDAVEAETESEEETPEPVEFASSDGGAE